MIKLIKKIVTIKNTGKFRACSPKGIQLNKFTIIYSENGRGKTTLSNIFRSLHEQNGELIVGRKTIGGVGEQVVDLLSEDGMLSFKGNKWISKPAFDIEIFDASFVSQNVYSRHIIEHDQKKQLYLFTIGKQGGEMADRLLAFDDELKKENAERKEIERELLQGVHGVLSANDFIELPPKADIDEEIPKQRQILHSLEKQSEIKMKPNCSQVTLPTFDKSKFLSNISGVNLQQLLNNAEDLTKQHIKQHLDPNGEKWLEYGVAKITDEERCPFCNQELNDVTLIKAFKTYFSDEYKKVIHTVNLLETAFAKTFAIDSLLALQKQVHKNIELVTYWKTYTSIDEPQPLELDCIQKVWSDFTACIKTLIKEKKQAPLEQVDVPVEKLTIIDQYLLVLEDLAVYNRAIDKIINIIEAQKALVDNIKIQDVKNKLIYYSNVKLRYNDEKIELIEKYKRILSSIKTLEVSKGEIRTSLNTYTKEIFSKYEQQINRHLLHCGASFKISDYKSSFLGGKPSSNFILNINNAAVELGNEKSPISTPSFKNTLSEGDKSSMAFAFFLAKLESDPEISKKVIIFDDPISSLDNHRKSYTADQVMKFSTIAKQVIVLTHDTYFARALWGKFSDKKTLLTQLCIKREGLHDSIIDTWDIDAETRSDYYQLFSTLADFLEGKPQ